MSIILVVIVIYYLFNRDFYLPFLGPAVIPVPQTVLVESEGMINVKLENLPKNVNVIYWASGKSDEDYKDYLEAYGSFANAGITKTDDIGSVVIKIACPAAYYVNKFGRNMRLSRHMHYRYEYPESKGLYSRIYTKYINECI